MMMLKLNPWMKWLAVGLVGFALGAVGGVGQADTKTVTEANPGLASVEEQTVTTYVTVHDGGRQSSMPHEQAPVRPKRAAAPRPRPVRSYKGDGSLNLPPLSLDRPATMHWTATGGSFTVMDEPDGHFADMPVHSAAASGQSYIAAGRHKFDVSAYGRWTITLTKAQ